MSKNYYQILGVRHSASQDELKKAYRKLASMYHPDKYPDDTKFAEDMMKQINIAYDFYVCRSRAGGNLFIFEE